MEGKVTDHHHVFTHQSISRAILAAAADAIVASDRDGIIQFWNPGAERIFGYGAAQAIGRSLDLMIPERLRAPHWEGYRKVMATGHSRYDAGELLSVPGLRRDGSPLSIEFTITPIHSEQGEIIGLVAVMRDVTARFEEIKGLRQKLRALTARGDDGYGLV
jgi:PAS domain S-box-containing protein